MAENTQNASEPTPPVAAPKKEKKARESRSADGMPAPFLVEFVYTITTIVPIFVGLTIIAISLLTGVSLFMIVVRTGVAMLVISGLLMLISSQIASGALNSIFEKEKQESEAPTEKSAAEPAPAAVENRPAPEVS